MSRPGVTYTSVARAAVQLVEQGKLPTIESIRLILGTGSNSTILRHLQVWKSKQGSAVEAQQGLPESLLIAVRGIYEALADNANEKVKAFERQQSQVKADWQAILAEKEQALKAALQQQQQSAMAQEKLQSSLNQSTQEISQLQQALADSSSELILAQTRLEDRSNEAERLVLQVQHAQRNLEHFRETTQQHHEEERQQHQAQIARYEQQIQQHRIALNQAEQRLGIQTQQLADLTQAQTLLEQAQREAQQEAMTQALALQKANLSLVVLEGQYETLEAANKDLLKQLSEGQASWHENQAALGQAQGQLMTLAPLYEKAEAKCQQLQAEKAALISQLEAIKSIPPSTTQEPPL